MSETARVTRPILVAIGLAALAVILWRVSNIAAIAFGGIVGATALRGLALPLSRRTRLPERWSLIAILAGAAGILLLLGCLFGPQLANEADEMQRLIPSSIDRLSASLQQSGLGRRLVDEVKRVHDGSAMLSTIGLAAGALVTGAGGALLVFFLSVYFAFDPAVYFRGFLRLFPPAQRGRLAVALDDAGDALRRWLLAQLLAMLIIGVLVGAGLGLLGVPLALLLAVLAGLLEFIPVVGPVLFTIPGVLVAFTREPTLALYALLLYVVVQQLESNVIVPLLQRWAVRLPPAVSLASVVVGWLLLGVPGVVIATPLAVVAISLVRHLYVEDTLERPRPVRAQ